MFNIRARNVSEAWAMFHLHMEHGSTREVRPRGILTREFREPVCTTYECPEECVLLDPVRDCNPFFHLYEALWMLSGRDDVARVKFYSPQVAQYSDDQKTFHGAYGYRWRNFFEMDQIAELVNLLKKDPDTRRGVLQMWDATDLEAADAGLDVPCNTNAYLKIREGKLNLTVCNRSNDAVWGCYGANAVQFSFLLQFMAARVGVAVGEYAQMSDSLHVYLEGKAGEVWRRCSALPPRLQDTATYAPEAEGMQHVPLIQSWELFLEEAEALTGPPDGRPGEFHYTEPWMKEVGFPMCVAHYLYRVSSIEAALKALENGTQNDPWIVAGREWLGRRLNARTEGQR